MEEVGENVMYNLMEQVKFEEDTLCYIKFNVNDDGTLDYDKELWKIVEPKLRVGGAQAHIFDILSKVYFSKNGWISSFTLQVDKKKPSRTLTIKLRDVNVELSGDEVIAEIGGVVNKNVTDVIKDIRTGYLPRIMEEFENLEKTQLKVDEAYAQMNLSRCEYELEMAKNKLKEAQKKIEEYKKNGGNYYGKKEKNN